MMKFWPHVHENHRQIARGMAIVAVLVLTGKFIAAAKEMAIAWRYGVSGEVEAYLLALAVTTWLPVILSSVSLVVFIPRLAGLDENARRRYVAELNLVYLLIAALTWCLTIVGGAAIAEWIAGDLAPQTRELAGRSVQWMSPIAPLIVVIGYLAVRLQSRRRFDYTFYEAMPAVFILLLVLLFPLDSGIFPVILGTVVGFGVQATILAGMARRTDGALGGVAYPDFTSSAWSGIGAAVSVMLISQLISGLSTPIDQIFAARVGDNAIATLGYANRIVALATALGATVVARATLPVFSAAVLSEPANVARRQAVVWLAIMLGLGSLAALVGWHLSTLVVRLLFERGAFVPEDTEQVSAVLRVALLQLPFYFANVVLAQWFAAIKKLRLVFMATTSGIAAKLCAIMVFADQGIHAVPLSTIAFYAVAFGVGLILLAVTSFKKGHT